MVQIVCCLNWIVTELVGFLVTRTNRAEGGHERSPKRTRRCRGATA